MFEPAAVLAGAFAQHLVDDFHLVYGRREPDHGATIRAMAQLAVERISSSDALYHDVQHTMMVTLVGQTILRGRIMVEEVTPEDWLHFTVATLCHDLGYLRGACPGDRDGRYVIDGEGNTVEAPRGASDAFLAPYHVERGKIFVRHRCKMIKHLDAERIARAIELTRFPIPEGDDYAETDSEPALVRAADLIGQLGDPNHAAQAQRALLGVRRDRHGGPARLPVAGRPRRAVPASSSGPRSSPTSTTALEHLERTVAGKQWIAQLYAHVFVEEHKLPRPGPERAAEVA